MPVFLYSAWDIDGRQHTGRIASADAGAARETLRERELYATEIRREAVAPRGLLAQILERLVGRQGAR